MPSGHGAAPERPVVLMPRAGRRLGDVNTKATIVEAARAEFLEHGYTATTIRAVARRAEVDPALVYHYFGDKPSLYVATLHLPIDPRQIRDAVRLTSTSPGVRLVEGFLAQWETDPDHPGQSFVTMAQAVSSSPEAANSLREFLIDRVWTDANEHDEAAHWRRAAISSQLMGMAWSRYIMRVEPLASASRAQIATRLGPILERLMFDTEPPKRNG
jgi:AcrR family transcriptional regulator